MSIDWLWAQTEEESMNQMCHHRTAKAACCVVLPPEVGSWHLLTCQRNIACAYCLCLLPVSSGTIKNKQKKFTGESCEDARTILERLSLQHNQQPLSP